MKILLIIMAFLVIRQVSAQDTIIGTAFRIVDGDTYWVDKATVNGIPVDPSEVFKIRIAGVDAPELRGYSDSDQPGGRMVSDTIRKLLKGRTVTVINLGVDTYGRIIGRVYCSGTDVTSYLLQNGFGWYVSTNGLSRVLRTQYKAELAVARNERRGIFKVDKTPETAAHFRKTHKIIKK